VPHFVRLLTHCGAVGRLREVAPGAARQGSLRDRTVAELRRSGSSTRAELARRLGTSRSTMGLLVGELLREGVLTQLAEHPVGQAVRSGRPGVRVTLDPRRGAAVGIEFGHRHVQAVVCDLGHTVLAEERRELPLGHDAEHGTEAAAALLEDLLARAEVPREQVVGVGLGLPGPVDRTTGMATPSSASMGWVGVPAAALLAARVGRPVLVDNDANLGARAELLWGAGRAVRDFVYVKLATGVGAGIVVGAQVLGGVVGAAGEIGHLTVDEAGRVCRCGNRGCLEGLVGAGRLLELLRPSHGELTVEQLCALVAAGDRGARRVVADAGATLGGAVADVVNILNPALVVVGGELAATGEVLLGPVRQAVARRAVHVAAEHVRVVPGLLGARAEALGAVALVLQESDRYVAVPGGAPPGPHGDVAP